MTISDWVMVLAVLIAPFGSGLALWKLQLWKEQRDRKLWVFRSLMATRSSTLSLNHVQALNLIELDFDERKDKPVIRAWKEYIEHLGTQQPSDPSKREAFQKERNDLLMKLLGTMGESLGYDFDNITLGKHGYTPQGWLEDEFADRIIRTGAKEFILGNVALGGEYSISEGSISGKVRCLPLEPKRAVRPPDPQAPPPATDGLTSQIRDDLG